MYRGLGSIDIAAIARSVLWVNRSNSDPELRYMRQIKSSLAPKGNAIAFLLQRMVVYIGMVHATYVRKMVQMKLLKAEE